MRMVMVSSILLTVLYFYLESSSTDVCAFFDNRIYGRACGQ
jgi:hypothetical protein